MEIKQSNRIQTSLINSLEKKILVYMAQRMPKCLNSDHFSLIGFIGACIVGAGFLLSKVDIHWLWLSCFGLLVNWFGDSLDGTIARVRKQQRPVYGFYLDHTLDAINECIMFLCASFSAILQPAIGVAALILYLLLSLNVTMNAHLRSEFKLTYIKLGPTELRIIIALINICFICIKPLRDFALEFSLMGNNYSLGFFDVACSIILLILTLIYISTIIGDIRYYSKIDPRDKK